SLGQDRPVKTTRTALVAHLPALAAETLTLPGPQRPVEILRDRWGTPHIYAQNTRDLFFAQGYAQAQDRLWQMEFTRRVGNGNLSALLGPDTLGIDRFMRTIGLRSTAERDWPNIRGEER